MLSLLTFCPPDPEDRTKLTSTESSGMLTSFGTVQTKSLRLLFLEGCLFVFGSYGTYSHVGTILSLSFSEAKRKVVGKYGAVAMVRSEVCDGCWVSIFGVMENEAADRAEWETGSKN